MILSISIRRAVGSRGEQFSLAGFGIEKAAHRIELAEIKSENFHVLSVLAVWGGMNVTVVVNATGRSRVRVARIYSNGSHPKPGTYMDAFVANAANAFYDPNLMTPREFSQELKTHGFTVDAENKKRFVRVQNGITQYVAKESVRGAAWRLCMAVGPIPKHWPMVELHASKSAEWQDAGRLGFITTRT